MRTKEQLRVITAYNPENQLDHNLIKLSENENIYGCSPNVIEAIKKITNLHIYPDSSASELKKALSSYHGVKGSDLFIGNGSDELIRLLSRAFICSGDEAIMAEVTFPRYRTNVIIEGGIPVCVPLENGKHDLPAMANKLSSRTKIMFICNPNNPTGTVVTKEELTRFIQQIPKEVLIILDEAYEEYVTSQDFLQGIPFVSQYPNLVVLRTFSKMYGLASLRVGYGIMNPLIIEALEKVRDVFNVSTIAQQAALAALEDENFKLECKVKNDHIRKIVERRLLEESIVFYPTQSNFIMIQTGLNGSFVTRELKKIGYSVRSGEFLGHPNWIRVAFGTLEDMDKILGLLLRLMKKRGEYTEYTSRRISME
ncbi:histidinol-phosphate transaminase [Bacillus coahuilensis]|uniref:histidinol-phosphate transaminase n=1 Tax=Bacillus coahuilensis TaxID=408580 RepID=UPI0001850ACC|nr:histidinol-phosphate transaminase [Bacillus coahuilensis]